MSEKSSIRRRLRTLVVYVILLHSVRVSGDLLIPNSHIGNRIRGFMLRPFLGKCGKRLAVAPGLFLGGAWNMSVGDDVYIAHRGWINATGGLELGDGVVISPNVVIATTAHKRAGGRVALMQSKQSPIKISAGSWIASNSVITRGSTIEEGVVVGANSVVLGTLEANGFYSGNPAKFIKKLEDDL